jgi:hypothetical protein
MAEVASPSADLPAMLERWVASGVITAEQADLIRADTAGRQPEPRGTSLVTEAMGYLGGVIILVALGLVTGQIWRDLPTGARLWLVGGVTVLLVAAGAGLGRRFGAPATRLRAVLWLAGTVALAGFLALMGDEAFGWRDDMVALVTATGCAVASAVLWWAHRHPLQHLAVLASLLATAGTATVLLPESDDVLPGLAIWGVAIGWSVLAWGGILAPRRAGIVLGAATGIIAAVSVAMETWGVVLALLTVAVLVAAAVAMRDLVLLAVASVGTLIVLPVVVDQFFPGVLPAAIALLGVGLLLVAVAVATARRRNRPASDVPGRDWSACPARPALAVAAVIAAATTATILGIGLT